MIKQVVVIKFGGSIFSTSEELIFNFKKVALLKSLLEEFFFKYSFVVVVGGGYVARKYINLIENQKEYIEGNLEKSKHEIGVAAINLNAVMLKNMFREDQVEEFIPRYDDFDFDTPIQIKKNILVSAAGHPGHSSDYNAFKLAVRTNSNLVVSLKDIDGVYSKDPKKFEGAYKIDKLTWNEYLEVIGETHFAPGANFPVDPITAQKANGSGVKFVIIKGGDEFEELRIYLESNNHNGTLIY